MQQAMELYPNHLRITWQDFARDIYGEKFRVTPNTPKENIAQIVDSTIQVKWVETPRWDKKSITRKMITIHLYSDTKSSPSILIQGYSTPTWVISEFEHLIHLVDGLSRGRDMSDSFGDNLSRFKDADDNDATPKAIEYTPDSSVAAPVSTDLFQPPASPSQHVSQQPVVSLGSTLSPLPPAKHWQETLHVVKHKPQSPPPSPLPATSQPSLGQPRLISSSSTLANETITLPASMYSLTSDTLLKSAPPPAITSFTTVTSSAVTMSFPTSVSSTQTTSSTVTATSSNGIASNAPVITFPMPVVHACTSPSSPITTTVTTMPPSCNDPVSSSSPSHSALQSHVTSLLDLTSATMFQTLYMANTRLEQQMQESNRVIEKLRDEIQTLKKSVPSDINLLKVQLNNERKAAEQELSQELDELHSKIADLTRENKSKTDKIKRLDDKLSNLSNEMKKNVKTTNQHHQTSSSSNNSNVRTPSSSSRGTSTENVNSAPSPSHLHSPSPPTSEQSNQVSNETYTPTTLLIGDSNLRHIRRRRLDPRGHTMVRTFPGISVNELTDIIKNGEIQGNYNNVILHVGTVDFAEFSSSENIVNDTKELIRECRKVFKGATVSLTQILPQFYDGQYVSTADVNSAIQKLCKDMQVTWIKLPIHHWSFFRPDGIHLNQKGVIALVRAIRPSKTPRVEEKPSNIPIIISPRHNSVEDGIEEHSNLIQHNSSQSNSVTLPTALNQRTSREENLTRSEVNPSPAPSTFQGHHAPAQFYPPPFLYGPSPHAHNFPVTNPAYHHVYRPGLTIPFQSHVNTNYPNYIAHYPNF